MATQGQQHDRLSEAMSDRLEQCRELGVGVIRISVTVEKEVRSSLSAFSWQMLKSFSKEKNQRTITHRNSLRCSRRRESVSDKPLFLYSDAVFVLQVQKHIMINCDCERDAVHIHYFVQRVIWVGFCLTRENNIYRTTNLL